VCRLRSGVTQAFRLRSEESVIGRETGMAVAVPMDGVSRQHARILFDGQSYTLEDLASTNGTFLNGQRVVREKLRHLDVVGLGKQAELVFVLRPEGAASVKRMGIVRAALVPDLPDALPYEVATGEAVLGRALTCNVVAEGGAVSKVHARVVRSADQFLVEDLGSANGTFVNGDRVMTAALRDGDLLALGGVTVFRVVVEAGEITSSSGSHPALPAPDAERFPTEWKTRFEWDASEQAAIAEVRRLAAERDERLRSKAGASPPPPPPRGHRTEAVPVVAKRPAAVATPKAPEAPATPVAPPKPAAPARSAAPKPEPQEAPPPPPAPAAPPAPPAPVAPAAPAAAPARPPQEASPEEAAAPASTLVEGATQVEASPTTPEPAALAPGPILEVRLAGPDIDVAVHETGAHTVGRAKDAGLRVNHPTVSRVHARLVISDDRRSTYIQDLGGANGTRVNGKPVGQMQPFSDGDTIGVGDVELRVSIRRGEPRPLTP
jgi:pSer/pThr/pTyr-binding forkhead associated (FHA) protein